jgi:hypothetical protein
MVHEFGHTYMLADCQQLPTLTVMNPDEITSDSSLVPLCCDLYRLWSITPSGRYGQIGDCGQV